MPRLATLSPAMVLLAAACTWRGIPVPVAGDLSRLAGEWDGSYSSVETGRSGSIIFQLIAGTDSAYGDVLMSPMPPRGTGPSVMQPRTAPVPLAPRALRISFVRSEGERVTGRLDVYPDPETEEPLLTKFEGRLHGDEIRGSYSTLATRSGKVLTGEWSAKRKGS